MKTHFDGIVELSKFSKTDGQLRTIDGVPVYRVFYSGEVTVRDYCRIGRRDSDGGLVVQRQLVNFQVGGEANQQTSEKLRNAAAHAIDPDISVLGQTVPIHGKVQFEKTERGWHLHSSSVLSGN